MSLTELYDIILSLRRFPWEGIVERDKSEDLPSVYNEIVPAANGLVCDLKFSRVTYLARRAIGYGRCGIV